MVTEARDRVGGNITTASDESRGLLWEEGPNSFQPSDAVLKAAVDAGCVDDLVFGDPKAPRFVFWEGRLRPTPSGPDVVTFDLMSLFGKIRAGLGAIGIKQPMPDYEESVEQFVRRNLGDEVFYRLIEPFCSGVYAGDPTKLSMKAAFGKVYDLEEKGGSIIGGVLKLIQEKKNNPTEERDPRLPPKPAGQTVGSFRKGLQMLPNAIANKLKDNVRVSWKLTKLTKNKETGLFELSYDTPDGSKLIKAKTVAMTVRPTRPPNCSRKRFPTRQRPSQRSTIPRWVPLPSPTRRAPSGRTASTRTATCPDSASSIRGPRESPH